VARAISELGTEEKDNQGKKILAWQQVLRADVDGILLH